jgi:ArsR family transcriptional regulator
MLLLSLPARVYTSTVVESIVIETTWPDASVPVGLLQAVADPVRWTVLARLTTGTACVCELQEHFPIAANLLSYHLKVLRDNGLVTTSRRGRWIDYSIAPDAMQRIREALPGGG